MQMNVKQLEQFAKSPEFKALAGDLLAKMAFSQIERARVDTYIKPIFESFEFYPAPEMLGAGEKSERITNEKHIYLAPDSQTDPYFAACHAAHQSHGFTGEYGYCPALIAEYAVIEAQHAILKHAGAAFGFDGLSLYGKNGEDRKKFLDLLLSLACKANDFAPADFLPAAIAGN